MVPSGPAECYGACERRALLSAPGLAKCFLGLHGLPRPDFREEAVVVPKFGSRKCPVRRYPRPCPKTTDRTLRQETGFQLSMRIGNMGEPWPREMDNSTLGMCEIGSRHLYERKGGPTPTWFPKGPTRGVDPGRDLAYIFRVPGLAPARCRKGGIWGLKGWCAR